jgi:hypothetical protein
VFWKKQGFEICIVAALIFLGILAIARVGKKGTWNSKVYSSPSPAVSSSQRKPPQESKGEIECRRVLESMFKKPFPKARPDILKNPVTSDENSQNNLELDCYNKHLGLAVEYNGVQHYKYVPYFHKTKDSFHNQKYRDYMKRQMCERNGIYLIEVPYTVEVKDIRTFISDKLASDKWKSMMK